MHMNDEMMNMKDFVEYSRNAGWVDETSDTTLGIAACNICVTCAAH